MKMIVNVDKNWAIGKDNRLLARIPEDMHFFKEKTVGNVVVMGRKTYESFPGRKALPDRVNIVFSGNPNFKADDSIVVRDKDELLNVLKDHPDTEVFVIGGQSIYELLEPMCDEAYVTMMDYKFDADAFFPRLSEMPEWEMASEDEEMTCFDIIYHHTVWKRKGK